MVNPCFLNGTYSPFLLNRPTNYCNSFRSNFVGVFVFIQKTFPKQKRVAFFSQLPPQNQPNRRVWNPRGCLNGTDPTLAQAGMMPVSVIWIMVSTLKGDQQKFFHCMCMCKNTCIILAYLLDLIYTAYLFGYIYIYIRVCVCLCTPNPESLTFEIRKKTRLEEFLISRHQIKSAEWIKQIYQRELHRGQSSGWSYLEPKMT